MLAGRAVFIGQRLQLIAERGESGRKARVCRPHVAVDRGDDCDLMRGAKTAFQRFLDYAAVSSFMDLDKHIQFRQRRAVGGIEQVDFVPFDITDE